MLSYSGTADRYLIEWDHAATNPRRPWAGGSLHKRKFVSRLNLRFDEEDAGTFAARVEFAMQQRFDTERRMRYQFQLSSFGRDRGFVPPTAFPSVVLANVLSRTNLAIELPLRAR